MDLSSTERRLLAQSFPSGPWGSELTSGTPRTLMDAWPPELRALQQLSGSIPTVCSFVASNSSGPYRATPVFLLCPCKLSEVASSPVLELPKPQRAAVLTLLPYR